MVFRFLYRSEGQSYPVSSSEYITNVRLPGLLKSLGLIPYSPSPTPEPEDEEEDIPLVDDGSLSREELFAELQKYKVYTSLSFRGTY